jgi:hypothetical protein
MKLSGNYRLTITGDTRALHKVSATTFKAIGYQMERLLTGQEAAVESELAFFGISVEQEATDPLLAKLREADELTVFQALEGANVSRPLTGTDDLIEFFNRMVDVIAGAPED